MQSIVKDLLWRAFAWLVSRGPVANWLIARATSTPYTHIYGQQGKGSLYMGRWWLFNPYKSESAAPEEDEVLRQLSKLNPVFRVPATVAVNVVRHVRSNWLPSARIHWILRPDNDRHLHSHPWDARTVILKNGYREERYTSVAQVSRTEFRRDRGYTGPLSFGEYHRISYVPPEGAWTLFITWKKQGSWGFDVDGNEVPWRQYLGIA